MGELTRNNRMAALRLVVLVAAALLNTLAHADADKFRRLNGDKIPAILAGKVFTDEGHWSYRFLPDGVWKGMELGRSLNGRWRIDRNELCVTRDSKKADTECFEIWLKKDEMEYRRDGVAVTTGVLLIDASQ